MVGSFECSENNIHSPRSKIAFDATVTITNSIIAGWLVKSVWNGEIHGSIPDLVCTSLPVLLLTKSSEDQNIFSAFLAGVNLARISYNLFKRQKTFTEAESQTKTDFVISPWHSSDVRKYTLPIEPMFHPKTKKE